MALDKEKQEKLEQFFMKKVQEQHNIGLKTGIMTACRAVLDMLNDGSKPFMTRIEAVKAFCKTPFVMSIEIKNNKSEESGDNPVVDEQTGEESENIDEASE